MRSLSIAALLVTLLGCSDSEPSPAVDPGAGAGAQGAESATGDACPPIPCPSGAPWDPASCSCKDGCDLPRAIAARLGPSDVRDCGELNLDASAQARNDARNCVLDALRGHRPFKLVQWQEATQHALTVGYVSAGGAAAISILRYDSDASAGKQTGATLAEARCGDLRPSSDCTIDANTLCLDCVPLIESSLECSQQLPPSDCHGTGNYEAGKGGEYRPCCAGLREVFQKIKLTNEAGNASCGDLPLRVYACVEGRCGDGRCEDAEAVPCGCALDCPSAAVLPR